MEDEADKIFRKHEGTIKTAGVKSGVHDIDTNEGRRSAAHDFIHGQMLKEDSSDSDQLELENAAVEEVEDLLISAHAKAKRPLQASEVSMYSAAVPYADLNESIVSIVQGKEPISSSKSNNFQPGSLGRRVSVKSNSSRNLNAN